MFEPFPVFRLFALLPFSSFIPSSLVLQIHFILLLWEKSNQKSTFTRSYHSTNIHYWLIFITTEQCYNFPYLKQTNKAYSSVFLLSFSIKLLKRGCIYSPPILFRTHLNHAFILTTLQEITLVTVANNLHCYQIHWSILHLHLSLDISSSGPKLNQHTATSRILHILFSSSLIFLGSLLTYHIFREIFSDLQGAVDWIALFPSTPHPIYMLKP